MVPPKAITLLDEYKELDPGNVEGIKKLVSSIEENLGHPLRVNHINSTKFGGGVAEILKGMMPLANSTGVKMEWNAIEGSKRFFDITKSFHNALQGMDIDLTDDMKTEYLDNNKANAKAVLKEADITVVHDPQPAPLILNKKKGSGKWIWRCHIDLTTPNMQFLNFLKKYVSGYDTVVFSLKEYAKPELATGPTAIIPPCIDPLNEKNRELSRSDIHGVLKYLDIDPDRPIIAQISRFDPWKDPLGVVDVYKTLKKKHEDLQLIYAGSIAEDDPEGMSWYRRLIKYSNNDEDIHVYSNIGRVGDIEINALQRAANVLLQMSVREGFGLSVTEGMWKRRPMVARGVGGIKLQITDSETGFLINTVEEAVEKTDYLLSHPKEAIKIGIAAHERVRKNFLITRTLKDDLELMGKLLSQ